MSKIHELNHLDENIYMIEFAYCCR